MNLNIVLVLFDSMRARNVSCYGYNHLTTPNLDRLAAEGVRFTNAFTPAPFTVASTASLLTSVYPSVHRLQHYGQRLDDGLITLPEVLHSAGYTTAGFVANPHINPGSGLTRGFIDFTDGRPWYKQITGVKRLVAWAESGKALNRCVKERLRRSGERPIFFFVFYNDSHIPFSALPRIFLPVVGKKFHSPAFEKYTYTDKELAKLLKLYDQSLQRADRRLGELYDLIRQSPYGEHTIFIISADHGEGLDRRIERSGHGRLYENGIHVPLVITGPVVSQHGKVVEEMVTSLDLAPTICEWTGIEIPEHWQGRSIASLMSDQHSAEICKHIICEYHDSRCVRSTRWKSIHRGAGIGTFHIPSSAAIELYDMENDPMEEEDLACKHPEIIDDHSQILSQFVSTLERDRNDPSAFKIDEVVIERLRGLGYME